MTVPTVTYRTIGATRIYTTFGTWESDTDNDLPVANVIEVGLVYADSVFAETVALAGATVDAGHFRVLMAAPGNEYDPITDTGVKIVSAAGSQLVTVSEGFAVLRGMLGNHTGVAGDRGFVLYNAGPSVYGERLCGKGLAHTVNDGFAIYLDLAGQPGYFSRCIAIGSDTDGVGIQNGFSTGNAASVMNLYRCVAHGCRQSAASRGFLQGAGAIWHTGCVGTRGRAGDFNGANGDFNSSSDATSPGANSLDNITAAQAFRNAAANDFRPPVGAPTIDKGVPFVPPFKPLAMALAPGHPLNEGLVLACPFADRVANVSSDISGKANHITLAAGAGDAAWSRHFPGATVSMDGGVAQPMLVAQTQGLPLYQPTGSWSVAMWVLTTTIAAGDSPIWIEKSSTTAARYVLSRNGAQLKFTVLDDNGDPLVTSETGSVLSANRWHSIVLTDDNGEATVYLDGVAVIGGAGYPRLALTDMTITAPFDDNSGTPWTGQCADIRLASRAWTGGEIMQLARGNPWGQYGGDRPRDFAGTALPVAGGASLDMGAYELVTAPSSGQRDISAIVNLAERRVIAGIYPVDVVAYHESGIVSVSLEHSTDGTTWETVVPPIGPQQTQAVMEPTGLAPEHYRFELDTLQLPEGEDNWLRARIIVGGGQVYYARPYRVTVANVPSIGPTVVYCAPGGNDTTGTGSQAAPWRTLTKAIEAAAEGATVELASGSYPVATPNRPGAESLFRVVAAAGLAPNSVVLEGWRPLACKAVEFSGITVRGASVVAPNAVTTIFAGCELTAEDAAIPAATWALEAGVGRTILERCVVRHARGVRAVDVVRGCDFDRCSTPIADCPSGAVIEGNLVLHTDRHGSSIEPQAIRLSQSGVAIVACNMVQGGVGVGLSVAGKIGGLVMVNNMVGVLGDGEAFLVEDGASIHRLLSEGNTWAPGATRWVGMSAQSAMTASVRRDELVERDLTDVGSRAAYGLDLGGNDVDSVVALTGDTPPGENADVLEISLDELALNPTMTVASGRPPLRFAPEPGAPTGILAGVAQ